MRRGAQVPEGTADVTRVDWTLTDVGTVEVAALVDEDTGLAEEEMALVEEVPELPPHPN